jgi:cytochrome b561
MTLATALHRRGRPTPASEATLVQQRYSPLNQSLHWFTAICMFAILPLAWVMTNAKLGTPLDETLFD